MEGQSDDNVLRDVAATVREKLVQHEEYVCPIKHLTDGTRISMVFWVADVEENLYNGTFGITVTVGKGFSHVAYNISTLVTESITTPFLEAQIVKARAIAAKSINKLDGSMGYKKRQAMVAFGNDSTHMGVEACCVCAEPTVTKTACNHAVCIPCLARVDKCPLCRQQAACSCCGDDNEDSDAEFD